MADYVVFDYMYCDASNYKAFGALLLTGGVTEEDRKRFISKLAGREFLLPNKSASQRYMRSCGNFLMDRQRMTMFGTRSICSEFQRKKTLVCPYGARYRT